jgi:hypothetical protein
MLFFHPRQKGLCMAEVALWVKGINGWQKAIPKKRFSQQTN